MNLRNLLLSVAALAATPLFAATYYVSPEGAGTKDGSSWDNALGVEELITQAAANKNGDVYNFAGGVYKPSQTIVFKITTGAKLIGNLNGERTIFSGDRNNNDIPDEGDASRIIRFQTQTGNGGDIEVSIQNIDFTCVITSATDDNVTMGALMIDNSGNVKIESCNFYNNLANGDRGGAALFLRSSTTHITKSHFYNNSAKARGGAVRLLSSGTNADKKGYTTFENCVFKDNTNSGQFGGAIFMAHGKQLNIVNSTIHGNHCTTDGAAIYTNGKGTHDCQVSIINSTIAGNTITGDAKSGQIVSTQTANIRTINSIIVSDNEKTADFYFKGATANSSFSFESKGYNYVGSVVDEAEATAPATRADETAKIKWHETDNVDAENTYASIFGENRINENNVIVPTKYFAGAKADYIEETSKNWGIPEGVNVKVDQNGKERTDGMMPGAHGITEKEISSDTPTSVINAIEDAANAPRLVKVANGIYTVEGATEGVIVYTVNGATVAATSGNTIDLSSFANGLYIIKSGNAIFKVMK